MKYIWIWYLPGAGGNFLSRALGLCDGVFSSLPPKNRKFDVCRKYEIYTYNDVMHRDTANLSSKNWVEFENAFSDNRAPSMDIVDSSDIPLDSFVIKYQHPTLMALESFKTRMGADDSLSMVLINSNGMFEWVFYNSLFKNSCGHSYEWFNDYQKMIKLNDMHNIQLNNIIDNSLFVNSYLKLCEYIGIPRDSIHMEYVLKLHTEWITTVLHNDDIAVLRKKFNIEIEG